MAKQKTKQQKSQKAKVQRTQDLPQQTKCEEKFAEGLCFKKLFFVFLVGSVIGTIYEELLYGVQTWYATGSWEWTVRRGVIYGPFNVIYGFGAVVMVYLLLRKKYTNWQIFLYASLLGGIVEYVVSLLQEVFTHTTSWDYSNYFLNINGRTTVPFMVVWGILGLFFQIFSQHYRIIVSPANLNRRIISTLHNHINILRVNFPSLLLQTFEQTLNHRTFFSRRYQYRHILWLFSRHQFQMIILNHATRM